MASMPAPTTTASLGVPPAEAAEASKSVLGMGGGVSAFPPATRGVLVRILDQRSQAGEATAIAGSVPRQRDLSGRACGPFRGAVGRQVVLGKVAERPDFSFCLAICCQTHVDLDDGRHKRPDVGRLPRDDEAKDVVGATKEGPRVSLQRVGGWQSKIIVAMFCGKPPPRFFFFVTWVWSLNLLQAPRNM